ncbi:hypothetical protein ACFP47_11535 [Nesterenkonia lacusekhoensis]|uniref:Uncharacterized protein n=1 Tax=Nesterenkonia lacusekhoensis TaxID=150832 RepID=A0ABS4T4U3_9MICC|nr:hypothetical protein [Nesterenkonia lacusekhoensis]MBP2319486.1 hypothetical protein [Nesterenkonia lacusekhoensis]
MGPKRITAAVLVAGLGLTACAYDGGEESEVEETAAPAPEETEGSSPEPEDPSSDEQEEESSSSEEIDPEDMTDEEVAESVLEELEAGLLEEAVEAFIPEEGDTYAQSWLQVTPRLSLWTIVDDEHGNPVQVDVVKYNCTGEAVVEGTGALEHVENSIYRANWEDASNPRRGDVRSFTRMTFDEEVLSMGGGSEFEQSADIEAELEEHIFQCRLIGEMVLP